MLFSPVNKLQQRRNFNVTQQLLGFNISMTLAVGLILLLGPSFSHAAAFAAKDRGDGAFAMWGTLFNGISTFNKPTAVASLSPEDLERIQLKDRLLEECQSSNSQQNRQSIEAIMAKLAPLSPVKATAESPLLKRKWMM
jgi:hypothetical protein